MSPRTTLAILGGLVAILGTPVIIFLQNILMNTFLLVAGIPTFPFPWNLWISMPWFSIFIWLISSFVAGSIAVFFVAPFAMRRIDSAANSVIRVPWIGVVYGALSGFLCCVLLASIRLSTDFVGPTLYRDGLDALPNVLRYYTTYVPISAITIGPFAAMFGGGAGAILELCRRRSFRERLTITAKTD